jgi:hypothetical protein
MAPQRLAKVESGPGNSMGSEASNPQDLVHGRAVDRARLPPFTATALPWVFPSTVDFVDIFFP